jgi:bacterial/archaeal transporter family-2 protein
LTGSRRPAGLSIAILGGVGLAGQGRVNGELGHRLDDGVGAALVSFASGLVLLALATVVLPVGRRGFAALRAALRTRTLRWWECVGGISGGYFVATQGLTVTALGLAVFTVALVAGQVTSSLFVDRAGLGPGGPRPISAPRVAAAALAVVAVVVALAGDLFGRGGSPRALGLAALPAAAGFAVAWQQAMNGRVQARAGAMTAATVNFAVGTGALVLAYAVVAAVRGLPERWPADWWVYIGGPLGIVFVLAAVAVVRVIGVLLLGLGLIAGQVLGSLALDALAPTRGGGLAVNAVVGAVLTLVAVVVGALPSGRRSVVPGR